MVEGTKITSFYHQRQNFPRQQHIDLLTCSCEHLKFCAPIKLLITAVNGIKVGASVQS